MQVRGTKSLLLALGILLSLTPALEAQRAGGGSGKGFTLDQVLSPPFVSNLVSARSTDRIAWLENERGLRNVYTAAAPDFEPVRLTSFMEDDGVDLSRLQISDDGKVLVFMRGHMPNRAGWVANPSNDADGGERAAWAVRTSGGTPWRIAEAVNVSLSPDGSAIVYLKDGEVYYRRVEEGKGGEVDGADRPLFRVYGRTLAPVWSPDSRKLAFVSQRASHSYIGVYDIASHEITYLAPGVDRDASPAWSPDSRRVAFLRRPGRTFGENAKKPKGYRVTDHPAGMVVGRFAGGHRLEIWVADAVTGEGELLWHPKGRAAFTPTRFAWVGDHLFFRRMRGQWYRYYSLDTNQPDKGPVVLTPRVGSNQHLSTSTDGKYLYFSTNYQDIDRRHLWRVPMSGGKPVQLTSGAGIETYPEVLSSGDQVAYLSAGPDHPQTVTLIPASGGKARSITKLPAEFPREAHVVPENVTLTAADGLEFNNQLFLPADLRRGERRPALIFIHGGPARQMLLGYHYGYFYHLSYAINQYFANKGYIVLSVNYRGGIGYGRSFSSAPNRGRRGLSEYQDILAAGQYLRERDDVDPEKIGLWGLSYGGYLTAEGLARNSDIFAAGADLAGVHLRGNALERNSVGFKSSSISQIENWRSPVFLAHGDDDRNVAFSHTVGLVQLLRAHEIPYELLVFPDEVHVFLRHQHWMKTFEAMDGFFDRTLIRGELKGRAVANSR